MLIAAVKGRNQIFAAVLDPCKAAAELPRQPDQNHIFGRKRHFLAEAAADIRCDYPQIRFGKAENVGNGGASEVRHLRGAGQCRAAGGRIEARVRSARLKRRRVLPMRLRGETDTPVCFGYRLVETCSLELALDGKIAGGMNG